jgi:nitroimidazol reductase NimA-like FMN-containing flavoprotein (pyridoxamine 5'-phosphate oxidase superfamily)
VKLVDATTGIEVLGRETCLHLLRECSVGRVAAMSDARLMVLPVNYAMDDDQVVFRTAPGTKLAAAVRGAPVAFEIDHADEVFQSGWSVMVSGFAELATDAEHIDRLEKLGLRPWAPGERDNWVVIQTETISGRRVVGLGT